MMIQIFGFILIILLLAYIVYLHIQLAKKNVIVESALNRLTGIEKSWKVEETEKFLQEIQKFNFQSSFFNDKLFDENILNYILKNDKDLKIFIHYTKYEADAKSIISKGFKFIDSFYKTALPVSNDKLDLIIKHNSRKYFGDYLIIICISNDIVNFYSAELGKTDIKNYFVENILIETTPIRNDNSDLEYLLPGQFIKGYINYRTGEIVDNPDFNPLYQSPVFMTNIERLKGAIVR